MVITNVKQRILEALTKSTEGMTIQDISRALDITRITVTKYVHELLGAEEISERRVGVYRFLSLSREKK